MKLSDYLDRIGYAGPTQPCAAVLKAIHRKHVETIPYENLDIQFGKPVTRNPAAIFDKLVTRKRGGWCYEMNGLLGWALEEIGFRVERLAGAVRRDTFGETAVGNHLVLIADLGEPWLVDAGFGDGLIEAAPLRIGAFENGPFHCRLEDLGGGWIRYHNDPRGGGPTYDFNRSVTDDALLERSSRFLQESNDSTFVFNAVVQRWRPDRHLSMRGRVLTTLTRDEKISETIGDAESFVCALREHFALDLPDAAALWPKICARHEDLFGSALQPY